MFETDGDQIGSVGFFLVLKRNTGMRLDIAIAVVAIVLGVRKAQAFSCNFFF
jgi:hypothetical protein